MRARDTFAALALFPDMWSVSWALHPVLEWKQQRALSLVPLHDLVITTRSDVIPFTCTHAAACEEHSCRCSFWQKELHVRMTSTKFESLQHQQAG